MKRLIALLVCSGALLCAADLHGVHAVYIMPMARGLDQYLANRLTNDRVFQVVTDPKLADAVFTDRIGEGFQLQLEAISPTPKPPEPEPKPAEKAEPAKSKRDKTDKPPESKGLMPLPTETVNKVENPGLNSTFGKGKGTIFLVDAKSRQVVWSIFDPAKLSADNRDLDRTASDIVSRLKKDLNPSKKK